MAVFGLRTVSKMKRKGGGDRGYPYLYAKRAVQPRAVCVVETLHPLPVSTLSISCPRRGKLRANVPDGNADEKQCVTLEKRDAWRQLYRSGSVTVQQEENM